MSLIFAGRPRSLPKTSTQAGTVVPGPPSAAADANSVNGNSATPVSGNVMSNDGAGTAPLAVTSVRGSGANVGNSTATTYGHVTMGSDGAYSYTLDTANATVAALPVGSTLTDTIAYVITDAAALTATANLVITINGAYVAAIAFADSAAVDSTDSGAVTGNVRTNDTGGAAPVTVTSVRGSGANVGVSTATTYGHITLNSDGTYSYVLDTANTTVDALAVDATLTDTIAYVITDAIGGTATANLVVTITGVEHAALGPTALWDNTAAHDGDAFADVSGATATYTGGGGWEQWGIVIGDQPISVGVDIIVPLLCTANGSGTVPDLGFALASVGEVAPAHMGSGVTNADYRIASLLINDVAILSESNWQVGVDAGAVVPILIRISRADPAAQTIQAFRNDASAWGTAHDVTSLFGTADVFPFVQLESAGHVAVLSTQAEVLSSFAATQKAAFTAALDAGYVAYSAAGGEAGGGGGSYGDGAGGFAVESLGSWPPEPLLGLWDINHSGIAAYKSDVPGLNWGNNLELDFVDGYPGGGTDWLNAVNAQSLYVSARPGLLYNGGTPDDVTVNAYSLSQLSNFIMFHLIDEPAGSTMGSQLATLRSDINAAVVSGGGVANSHPFGINFTSFTQYYSGPTGDFFDILDQVRPEASGEDYYDWDGGSPPTSGEDLGLRGTVDFGFDYTAPEQVVVAIWNLYGPHPSTQTFTQGKPFWNYVGVNKISANNVAAYDPDPGQIRRIMAGGLFVGVRAWPLFSTVTNYITGNTQYQWSPGIMAEVNAFWSTIITPLLTDGFLMKAAGGPNPFVFRLSAPADTAPNSSVPSPAATGVTASTVTGSRMPYGFMGVKLWNEAKTDYKIGALRFAKYGATLAGQAAEWAVANGVYAAYELKIFNSDGTLYASLS